MPFLPLPPRTVGAWGRKRFVGEFHTRGGHTALCCCLISSFYIKPQRFSRRSYRHGIVLYRLSTSNHNISTSYFTSTILSYIVFLHQTTTTCKVTQKYMHCLISSFYIKPQLQYLVNSFLTIVLYCLSTSNHNSPSTESNVPCIVLYCLSTSNHNKNGQEINTYELSYIVFLHQTTTSH